MEADPEHQQDDADLGELRSEFLVRHVARSERADEDAGQKVADQGRKAQTLRKDTEHERQTEACQDRRDERGMVRQGLLPGRRR